MNLQYNVTYRQKDKGWQYIISYKEDGKWRQKSKQGFRTRGLAKVAADERLGELKESSTLSREYEDITFKGFFDMLIEHEKLYKEQNTLTKYYSVATHLEDIWNIPISKITTLHIQGCIDEMIRKGLAGNTIKSYASTVKTIFNRAVDPYNLILQNPASNTKLPKISKQKDRSIKALTQSELRDLYKELDGYVSEKEYIAALLAGTCGLRVGEILGLTWDKIDFKKSTLKIDIQWKRLKGMNGSEMGFGTLKSQESYRTVPIPPVTLSRLKRFKKDYPVDISNRIVVYKNVASLSRDLPRKFDMVGYNITMHTLRHTYATLLIANGTDFKTAAKLLGHNVEMTLNTYSHVTDDMLDRANKIIKSIF